MNILIAIIVFSVLILFHEFGHFLLARLCRVRVIEFSLGMGPRLLSHVSHRSGTRYSLKALPFGGSCEMQGEFSEEDGKEDEKEDEMEGEAGGREAGGGSGGSFESRRVWQRMLIVAAGPVFNFLLAFLFSLFLIGQAGYDPPVVLEVESGSPAAQAGIEAGDWITKIGRSAISLQRDISVYTMLHSTSFSSGQPVTVCWTHEGEERSAQIVPEESADGRHLLGISTSSQYRLHGGILTTVRYSFLETGYWIRITFDSLGMLLRGQVSADDVSGPVRIVKTISDTVEESREDGMLYVWLNVLQIAILLSANLGVMNLLPLPALDGGRLLFLVAEAVTRRKPDRRFEQAVNYAGFMVLMGLALLLVFHDLQTIFR
ncbi:M50 family metallopeptidase [Porcincola sp. LCP21S3_C12]|uniref:M50 family metallopeptidase n=1 Tax=Porcincola sp. LCP21S3_C12 TaxID=3438798 RepID=UPI003F989566